MYKHFFYTLCKKYHCKYFLKKFNFKKIFIKNCFSQVPSNSILRGCIDLTMTCRLRISIAYSGFLSYAKATDSYPRWDRRWCHIDSHKLMFWNDPVEQDDKDPVMIIDLVDCVSYYITNCERALCSRTKTLLLETAQSRGCLSSQEGIVLESRNTNSVTR